MIKRAIILLPATLDGMGCSGQCEVLVRKQPTVVKGAASQGVVSWSGQTYTDCSIIGAPEGFPDGEYLVRFDGFSVIATCHGGVWLAKGQPRKDAGTNPDWFPLAG